LTAFNEWKDVRRTNGAARFLRDNFNRMFQMDDLQKTVLNLLVGYWLSSEAFNWPAKEVSSRQNPQQLALVGNANASNLALVKAVLCAGLYPILVAPKRACGWK
jgi:hypothetical protein